MSATVSLTYTIPRNAQAAEAQRAYVESVVLEQGELLPLGLTTTSDTTEINPSGLFITRTIDMVSPDREGRPSVFEEQFKTEAAQRSAVNRLYLGRLQLLGLFGVEQATGIEITSLRCPIATRRSCSLARASPSTERTRREGSPSIRPGQLRATRCPCRRSLRGVTASTLILSRATWRRRSVQRS